MAFQLANSAIYCTRFLPWLRLFVITVTLGTYHEIGRKTRRVMDIHLLIAAYVGIALFLVGLFTWMGTRRSRREDAAAPLVFDSMAGPLRVYSIWRDDDAVRVMDVQGTLQSATYLQDWKYTELVFDYTKFYNRLFETGISIEHMLMLGGGGYSYPKYVISHCPDVSMDVVEIDPKVTLIARRYFFLDRLMAEYDIDEENGRLQLICDGGRHFLEKSDKRYSAIINDCFTGLHFAEGLATLEAVNLYHDHLVEDGVYLSNVIGALEGERSWVIQCIVATLSSVFKHVYIIPGQPEKPMNCDNNVVIATDGDWGFSDTYPFRKDPTAIIYIDSNVSEVNWIVPTA